MMNALDVTERLNKVDAVFTPSAPIEVKDLFAGRVKELNRVIDAVHEPGQHVILYGERGVGKTSMANILQKILSDQIVVKVTCGANASFKEIWQGVFESMMLNIQTYRVGFRRAAEVDRIRMSSFLETDKTISPNNIQIIFSQIGRPVVVIIDEYDQIADPAEKKKMASTIKVLSDNVRNLTLVVVGVAESVTQLIGDHPSLERCLKQIKVPRMSNAELRDIIEHGLKILELDIDLEVRDTIIMFSNGFPHYIHLLCKYAAKNAVLSGHTGIAERNLELSIEESITNCHESIRQSYFAAVMTSKQGALFRDVLFASAMVEEDEAGTFRALDLEPHLKAIRDESVKVNQYSYHLGKLCSSGRGEILIKVGSPHRHRYKFSNPLMKAYILLLLYQKEREERRRILTRNSNKKPWEFLMRNGD